MSYLGQRSIHRLHRVWMLLMVSILVGVLSGCGRMQQANPSTQDDYSVTLAIEPTPASVGPTSLKVILEDRTGQPVNGARLEVEANMSHAGMVPVLASTADSDAGLYRVSMQWTMAGDWFVDLNFTLPNGERITRRFPVQVQ